MTTRNENYISSLISYINDVKPYRTKLTEIVEEIQFFDSINVKITEDNLFHIHLNSTWTTDNYYSDGQRVRYTLPPFLTPRYSTDVNNFKYTTTDQLDYLATNFGISNAFQVNSSQGLEAVLLDGKHGIEGYDFYLSKGVYSISTVGRSWHKTNSSNELDGTIVWMSSNPWMNVTDIVVPPHADSVWKIEVAADFEPRVLQFEGTTATINLDNSAYSNIYYEVYEGGEIIIPHSIVEVPGAYTTFTFSSPAQRLVRISSAPDDHVFTFTNSNVWVVNHTLATTLLNPQCYIELNGAFIAILPESVEINSADQVTVRFGVPQSGKVVLREVSHQHSFVNESTVVIPYTSNTIDFWTYVDVGGVLTSIIHLATTNNGLLTINFSQPYTGIVNFALDVAPDRRFTVTDTFTNALIGTGNFNQPFTSSVLSFTPNFSGALVAGDSTLIRPGDYISISSNAVDQTWSVIKINPIAYSYPVFSGTGQPLQLTPFAPSFTGAPAEVWTFTWNGTDFSVEGSKSGTTGNLKIGPWYDNNVIRVRMVLDPSFNLPFNETFIDEANYVATYHASAATALQSVINVGDMFTLEVFEDRPNYIVYGSVTKEIQFATVGKYFWNGQIGFLPALPYYSVTPSDELYPVVITADPAFNTGYLLNRNYDEYAYGEFYEADIMTTIEGQNTVNSNPLWFLVDRYPTKWNIRYGTPYVQQRLTDFYEPATLQLNFYEPPRFDASDERFDLLLNDATAGSAYQQFFVNSDIAGALPTAVVGFTYTNFETAALSLTYGNAGAFNVEIMANGTIPPSARLTINIKSNFLKPFHSRDVVIIDPSVTFSTVTLRTFNNDKLDLSINAVYPELGLNDGYGDQYTIPTFIRPAISDVGYNEGYDMQTYDIQPFEKLQVFNETLALSTELSPPSRMGTYDLLLSNAPFLTAGTISYLLDASKGVYVGLIDFNPEFVSKYLPSNMKFSLTANQTDEYNHQTSVMVSEELIVQELVREFESMGASVSDSLSIISKDIHPNSAGSYDAFAVEKNISLVDIYLGYDLLSFDTTVYDVFTNSAPGYTFAITDYPNPETRCWYKIYPYNVTQLTVEIPSSVYENNLANLSKNLILMANYVDTTIEHALDTTVTLIEGVDYQIVGLPDPLYVAPGFHDEYGDSAYCTYNNFLNIETGGDAVHVYKVEIAITNPARFIIAVVLDYSSIPTELL